MNGLLKGRSASGAYASSSQAQASNPGARPSARMMPMFARLPLKTAFGAAALAAAGLMLTPATASAQAYSYNGQQYGYGNERQSDYGYDRSYGQSHDRSGQAYCLSERRNRQGNGALVGATFGAVLGSQMGARGRRTEGSVLGAVIGGALGAAVGGDSARDCNGTRSGYAQYGYGNSNDDRDFSSRDHGNYGYSDRYDAQSYGDQGYEDRSNDGYQSDCRSRTVHSRDRYGRTVTRYEQTC
jgi:hypothetical protein